MTVNVYSCYCGGADDCADCFGTGYRTAEATTSPTAHISKLIGALLASQHSGVATFDRMKTHLEASFQRATAHYREIVESNRNLQEQVRSFGRMLGQRAMNHSRWDGNPHRSLLSNPDRSAARRGLELMVKAELRSALGDEVLSPAQVREHLRRILDRQLEDIIRKHLGIAGWERRLERGPLLDTLNEHLTPHVKAAVEKALPAAMESLDLEAALDHWQQKGLRDAFTNALRSAIQAKALDRAEEIASAVVHDEVDAIIFDEFPYLKRYVAKDRLGGRSSEG